MITNFDNLVRQNINIVGVSKEKMPFKKWGHFRESQTLQEKQDTIKGAALFAVICTDGIECIDIDTKYDLTGQLAADLIRAITLAIGDEEALRLLSTHTQSGGMHLVYRCRQVSEGSMKLAQRYTCEEDNVVNEHDKVRVLIETRGDGGYFVFPPSEGYEFDNSETTLDNFHINTIDLETRNKIIEVCRGFNEVEELNKKVTKPKKVSIEVKGTHKGTIQDFNEQTDIEDLLESLGFTFYQIRGDNKHYTRAGKKNGVSASVHIGHNTVYNFSDNSPCMDANTSYDAFALYAAIEHNNDASAAAKDLYKKGYGDRMQSTKDRHTNRNQALTSQDREKKEEAQDKDKLEKMFDARLRIEVKPPQTESHFFYVEEPNVHNVFRPIIHGLGGYGELYTITGADKSGKTRLKNWLVQSCLTGDFVEGWKVDIEGKNIIDIDTEQSAADTWKNMSYIMKDAGLSTTPENYYNFSVGEHDLNDMLAFIEYSIERIGNVGAFFLDGIVDLCPDYNDLKASQALIKHIRHLSIKHGVLFFSILHNARSTGGARGHLGTESLNKSKVVIDSRELKEPSTERGVEGKGTGVFQVSIKRRRGGRKPQGFDYMIENNKIVRVETE